MNNYDDETIAFLCKEENLRTTLEICSKMDDVKQRLHDEFWLSFYNTLKLKLDDSPYADSWKIEQNIYTASNDITLLVPLSPQTAEIGIGLTEEGKSKNYHPFYFIWFRTARKKKPELSALRSKLKIMGFKKSLGSTLLMHKYLAYHTGRKDFLLRVAANPDDLAQEIVDGLWIVFEQINAELWDANIALSNQ